MKFYNREAELSALSKLQEASQTRGVMTVLTGRRRVGKTRLAMEFAGRYEPYIYCFFSRKSEVLLCDGFVQETKKKTGYTVPGQIRSLNEYIRLLIQISGTMHLTVVFDEFQEICNINPGFISDLQMFWDTRLQFLPIHLIISGSVYALMHRIFEDSKQPLFGRTDSIMRIQPFSIGATNSILKDMQMQTPNLDFYYYAFTGGMPRYIQFLIENHCQSLSKITGTILSPDSILLNEGRYLLIQEFGRDYLMYFSILELIAAGKTSRSELESVLQKDIGGYLDNMENQYHLLERVKPILAKPQSRRLKYKISEPYFSFWFRFIHPHLDWLESGQISLFDNYLKSDLQVWLGRVFENYTRKKLIESGEFTTVGSWWDTKNLNEIDVVAINEFTRVAVIADVKLKKSKINLDALRIKAVPILLELSDYRVEYRAYYLE